MNARKIGLGVLVGVCLLVSVAKAGTPDVSLTDVTRWVGTGSNQAGILVQWNDGDALQQELWGYQWNDPATPTGADVMLAVAAGSPNLNLRIGADTGWGHPFFGIGLDSDGGTFEISDPAVVFTNGVAETGYPTDDITGMSTAVNPADRYAEGWMVGYWGLYEGTVADGWTEAGMGAGGTTVDDGDWLGWNFSATGWNDRSAPTATVPEPATMSLLAVGGIALLKRRKK